MAALARRQPHQGIAAYPVRWASRHVLSIQHRKARAGRVETVKNARYPLELFQRVITVSLRTMAIVRGLPDLGV